MRKITVFAFALGFVFIGCARAPLRTSENAMRRVVPPPALTELQDDLPLASLVSAVAQELNFFEKNPPKSNFVFGDRSYTPDEYLKGLRRFLELGKESADSTALLRAVREEFDFFEVYGQKNWGEAFITSYYEPLIEGSRSPSVRFSQPIYSTPTDLVSLNLGLFDPKFQEERRLRGRLQGKEFLPYFNREEIDSKKALQGRGLEICYVDPIEAFFLQVQGSGTIKLDDGSALRLNYAEKNGQPYESLSKFLRPYIPIEQMNLHTIEAYLRKLSKEELQKFLNRNPSYVFFQSSNESAVTSLGLPATDGRTIATDPRFFPKGAIAFLQFEKPVFDSPEAPVPSSSEPIGRFVLDQDIGGAITGGGRLDLFWGRGVEAKRYAGAMKTTGRLYYLGPKAVRD